MGLRIRWTKLNDLKGESNEKEIIIIDDWRKDKTRLGPIPTPTTWFALVFGFCL